MRKPLGLGSPGRRSKNRRSKRLYIRSRRVSGKLRLTESQETEKSVRDRKRSRFILADMIYNKQKVVYNNHIQTHWD